MEIERDVSIKGYEVVDREGNESQVIYCEEGFVPTTNPVYRTGFGKRQFIVISCMDGGKRVNKLLISDKLLKSLK